MEGKLVRGIAYSRYRGGLGLVTCGICGVGSAVSGYLMSTKAARWIRKRQRQEVDERMEK